MAIKTTASLPFSFFFLLAAFTTTGDKVYDTEGKEVDKADTYFILPSGAYEGKNIAITPIDKNQTVCGLFLSVISGTEPLVVNISTESELISTHSPVNFSFVEPVNISGDCAKSTQTQWLIAYGLPPPPYVMIGDPRETDYFVFNGSFYINLADVTSHTYTLSFCDERENCASVGVQEDERMILLTKEQQSSALRVKFRHVTPSPPPPAAARKLVLDF